MVCSLFAPFVAPLVLVGSVILIGCRPGFPRSVFLQRRLPFGLRRFFLSFLSCRFVRRFACRFVSCRFSFRLVVSGVGALCCWFVVCEPAGGEKESMRRRPRPLRPRYLCFIPPLVFDTLMQWELGLVVFVRRVFFFAVVGRCTAICGVVLLWLVYRVRVV